MLSGTKYTLKLHVFVELKNTFFKYDMDARSIRVQYDH